MGNFKVTLKSGESHDNCKLYADYYAALCDEPTEIEKITAAESLLSEGHTIYCLTKQDIPFPLELTSADVQRVSMSTAFEKEADVLLLDLVSYSMNLRRFLQDGALDGVDDWSMMVEAQSKMLVALLEATK